ncbi:MAG: hypothetical protein WCH83_17395 [Alphaproteobacteria bacterium]|jgi:hypothetical protein
MSMTRLVVVLVLILIVGHPPLVLGMFGPEGRRMGEIIDRALGTDDLRLRVFGVR